MSGMVNSKENLADEWLRIKLRPVIRILHKTLN